MSDRPLQIKPYEPRAKNRGILARAWEYVKGVEYRVSLRWLFYKLYADRTYPSKKDWPKFKKLMSRARKGWFSNWRPWTLKDDMRPAIVRRHRFEDESAYIKYLRGLVCHLDAFKTQSYYVECWYEARAMSDQFREYVPEFIRLQPIGGDASIDIKFQLSQRIDAEQLPGVILYFGDYGEKASMISDAVEKDVKAWSLVGLEFIRCGLSLAQIEKYGVTTRITDKGVVVEGEHQWEGLDDEDAKAIIENALAPYVDLEEFERIKKIENEITERIRAFLPEVE